MKNHRAAVCWISAYNQKTIFAVLFQTLFLCSVFVFSAPTFAQTRTCDHIKKPALQVNINLTIPEAAYNYQKSLKELTSKGFEGTVEWLQKQGIQSVGVAKHLGQFYNIRGVASGGYAYAMDYRMQAKFVDSYGVYYCPYLTEVNIELFYGSTIYIAKEIPRDSCEFNEVMKHEWKHHTANVMAIQTYSERLKKDLPIIARDIELKYGYVDRSKVQATFDSIKQDVKDMIDIYYETIRNDSEKRNDMIDTPAEYDRVDASIELCEKEETEEQQIVNADGILAKKEKR